MTFPTYTLVRLAAIEDVEGFGGSSKPKGTCDEEVRRIGAVLNE